LRARSTDDVGYIVLDVSDNGCGIRRENLERLFHHGFTTKANGNGFGLHSSACSARVLGGSLTAQSDGEACGATFTLILRVAQGDDCAA
jgi:C4-dicarboxylate-specific signal transduction histidine kinase